MTRALHTRIGRAIKRCAPVPIVALALCAPATPALGAGEVAWRLEQPAPPAAPAGAPESSTPIGLGKIGDIEFWAPNRGLLITAGNPPTIPPGIWAYNGQGWHELASVCGATDGRIAWAGPEEFWTISDGRPGQIESATGALPPLEDNTLCRFAGGQVAASYAHPAFQSDSYLAMHAAGCITPSDCWFGGEPLPEPQYGAFQLHWNGGALEAEPYPGEGHAIEDMRLFENHLYESVRVNEGDRVAEPPLEVPVLHRINPEGVQPALAPELGVPLSGTEEPNKVDYLHLSVAEGAFWAAAGSQQQSASGGEVTVLRRTASSRWSQLLGPATGPTGAEAFPLPEEVVNAIAAEPGTNSAWLALQSHADALNPSPSAPALVAHVSAEGKLLEEETLPAGGAGARGSAAKLACPAVDDCWLATTQGWLFHLAPADERTLALDNDPAFAGLITYRPPDQGLPQIPPDAPPVDDSGLGEEPPPYGTTLPQTPSAETSSLTTVPLLSHLHSRLVHGTTLELRFHLAVKARVRLLAKRHKRIVAATAMRTLKAGERRLLLRLNRAQWPTALALQTHALARLPSAPAGSAEGGGGGPGPGLEHGQHGLLRAATCPGPLIGIGTAALRHPRLHRRRRLSRPLRSVCIVALAGLLALVLTGVLSGAGTVAHAGAQGATEVTPQTDASLPARDVTMIGATPQEAGAPGANETWGVGTPGDSSAGGGPLLVRYTTEGGWSLGPTLLDAAGQPLAGFKLDPSPLAGAMTPTGAGVLSGELSTKQQVLLVRSAGGAFQEPSEAPPLKEGELLFGSSRAPLIAALDEGAGKAGALVVPVGESSQALENSVLHWDGTHWTRETIEVPAASSEEFHVLGIGAASPTNAWLLAQLSSSKYPAGSVALFRRVRKESVGTWVWEPVALSPGAPDNEAHPLTVPVTSVGGAPPTEPFTAVGTGSPPKIESQALTVTGEGVWIDGQRADVHTVKPASTTIFFKPEGEAAAGQVTASWCLIPAGAPSETPHCQHELPEALPTGPSRSVAWGDASTADPYGERVVTGLREGVSLRLEGDEFKRVLALGENSGANPGAQLGAAFANAKEGWLGAEGLPVHLTLAPTPSELQPWPVPFRHALTAIAPAPGASTGALSSEALAVGDQGEVARFKPGEGWLPESLFGPGENIETPRLRAVAWPTPQRAYAVGDKGQMWLWRGETGLWEKDPATPPNFRANLLGIAFEPGNRARGYAVGSTEVGAGGVLLRYGKTWTQEATLPPQVTGASFTSVAFAGSEAIVAYRRLVSIERDEYVGGILIENGSGWQVDQGAAALVGANAPLAVAGLPDGGAAFSTVGPEGTRVFERESASAPWQPTPEPITGATAGSLALYREGGALRAIVTSGGSTENYRNENEPPAPAGFPPNLIGAYPIGESGPTDGVLRQTATGWSDVTHELDPAAEPEGGYVFYDLPYRPEPVLAVLAAPDGDEGWAVGGEIHENTNLDTSSVERYPANVGVAPLGLGTSQIPIRTGEATFAIGGDAQCAAVCDDRANAGIGPDVWLTDALSRARQIGVRAFLYTGPYVTNDQVSGLSKPAIPFEREFADYEAILASGMPAYAAASPQDLDARPEAQGSEALYDKAFAGFPRPFGYQEPTGEIGPATPEGRPGEHTGPGPEERAAEQSERLPCVQAVGEECDYYALVSGKGSEQVRVIVLDDTREVDSTQLGWLVRQLQNAKAQHMPAIVVGNANLNAQITAGDVQAKEVAKVLLNDSASASAYFYDAPEENVTAPLQVGAEKIPTFGSGTLGYVNVFDEESGDFHGASGFLLGEVDVAAYQSEKSYATNNRAKVSVRLIPNIGELALEAKDGILLRRSEPALFQALARRPRAGSRARGEGDQEPEVDPYIPIPSNCVGSGCATALLPEYSFSSSRTDVGGFVKPNLISSDPHAVLESSEGEPVREPINPETGLEESKSGLFCAYNAGTTTVTISAGGLSASLPVTVQAGSVRQPCGTVPLKEVKATQTTVAAPPPAPAPAAAPTGASPAPAVLPPVPPVPPVPPAPPVLVRPAPPHPAPPAPFFVPLVTPIALAAFVPPPLPPAANPTPPSGTSAVTSPVEAAQKEEEEEEATESVSNQAVAYRTPEHEPTPLYVLGAVLLAAFAGASARRRPRRGRRDLRVAPATLTGARAQRRLAEDDLARRGVRRRTSR